MNTKQILQMKWVEATPEYLTPPKPVVAPDARLSDLITIGARQTVMLKRGYFYPYHDGRMGACALGAAAYALKGHKWAMGVFGNGWGVMADEVIAVVNGHLGYSIEHEMIGRHGTLSNIVLDSIDRQGWDRYQVANWLRRKGY